MKKSIYLLLISLTFQNVIIAQNKFYIGLNSPFHFGSGRFGSYLDMKNEMQDHTGKDALKFGLSAGFGVFGSLLFEEDWSFDFYWNRFSQTTNFGKNNLDNFTIGGASTTQYKITHGLIGVGASRKVFKIKDIHFWLFSSLSAGSRNFEWRTEDGEFSKERRTNNRLFIASTEAPIFLNIGLSPKFLFAEKFYFTPRIGFDLELMKGDGSAFGDGLPEIVQASYAVSKSQADMQAIMSSYGNSQSSALNRFFIELRFGIKLGK